MPTIGHLIIGIVIPVLIYYTLNKNFSIEICLYFIVGSILIDTYSIIKIFIFPDIVKYITWNVPHGFFSWIICSFIITSIFYLFFRKVSKLRFIQIFYIILLAGWIHLGLDMLVQPVRIIGELNLSILDFYTKFMILEEQDFIVVFYIIFIFIPTLLLIRINKINK